MASTETSANGQEPPMFLQRPSSAKSQDVQHVLARTFRQLFTRDAVAPDTVQNLSKSRGGEDSYHERYVEALQKVQEERERRMAEAAMLERHIMQAQARAMSADERLINRAASSQQGFPDLGLPPVRAHFKSCIDTSLLKQHNLITPDDYRFTEAPIVPPPSAPKVPLYARETHTSNKKKVEDHVGWESPLPPHLDDQLKSSKKFDAVSESDGASLNSLPRIIDSRQLPPTDTNKAALWKDQILPVDREQHRKDLANLEGRVDYLKNPRHQPPSAASGARTLVKPHKKRPKEVGIKPPPPQRPEPKEPSTIFIPSSEVVTFSHYSVGQVYELTLQLKNITTVLRPVRVLPPKTQFFSLGLGQFPGEHGLVAPGMSCHYTICFAPDSLGDYDDEIVVQTQSSTDMVIKIQGRRPPPVLTMPEVLDCGECLVGGVKVAQFTVKNEGGPGRFAVLKRETWPAANFKSVTSMGAVTIPPFEVRPSVFELNRNEKLNIEVLFVPNEVETFSHDLTIVCDNCHVKQISVTGKGQVASVELTSVEEGLSEPLPDELCDITAQHLVKFSNLNPFTYVQKMVTVKNTVNVDLRYNWITVKPYIRARDPEGIEQVPIPSERIQDVDSAFSIEPDQGILRAGESQEYMLTFAPPVVQSFHNVLHMVLRGIPKPRPKTSDTFDIEENNGKPEQAMQVQEPDVEDVTALEIETKGVCEPLSVILQPYALHIPGQLMVQTATKRQFRMINNSLTAILFQWENVSSESLILEVEPPIGELMPQSDMDFDLTVCASQPGKVDHTLQCFVQHMDEPLSLHVDVEIKGPEIVIEQPNINFGLVRLGDRVAQNITIRNDSRVVAKWWIKESPMHRTTQYADESEFTFEPSYGDLAALETKNILVVYKPDKCQSLRTIFEIRVDDGNDSAIQVLAEVQNPEVCLLTSKLKMKEVYLDVPVCNEIHLLNQTMLPTTFEWGEAEGKQASLCSVSMEPKSGHFKSREKVSIAVHFTSHTAGKIHDVAVPCKIGGMRKPIFLLLRADVKGLSVSYQVTDELKKESASDELSINYGQVGLGEVHHWYIQIKNQSAISAPYSINVDYFFAKPPTPPERRLDFNMPSKTQRRSMLAKTPNLADPLSKTDQKRQAEINKMMLKEGKGVSFTTTPSTGVLQPFGTEFIEVSCFSDMWGEYQDMIYCKVGDLETVEIPVTVSVSGSPLQFQMVAAKPNQQPILRFGTQVSGVAALKRQMRINNSSPYDVRLDWQVFNKEEDERKQVVDFIVNYGKLFPEKDAAGNEIVPAVPGPPKPLRHPTDMIPNTPDTSKAGTEIEGRLTQLTGTVFEAEGTKKGPKVVSVTLREHEGVESYRPYSIVPDQVVIPARGSTCINVNFQPFPNDEVTEEIDCMAYALGYVTITDQVSETEGKVSRLHGYDMEPLRLEMTGQIKPALLRLECTDEDGMNYWAAASDLMTEGQLQAESHKMCSATISNTTLTQLDFRLLTSDPFQIVEMDRATRKPRIQLLQTDMTSLQPRQNMLVQVGFRVSTELLEYLEVFSQSGSDTQRPDGIELEDRDGERKLHFTQDLIVEFNNKTQQKLPLYATLVIPSLTLSKTELDFGTCLVGQRRELQLMIVNPTQSASFWVSTLDNKSDTVVENTFEMIPSSGMLEAQVSFVSKNKALLKVYFEAKHSEEYKAEFVFNGMLGEVTQVLTVRGCGSYDGKHEAIVNL